MPSDFDKWLNGVDRQLPELSLPEIDKRILRLRSEIESAEIKIGILRQLRERVAPPRGRVSYRPSDVEVLSERRTPRGVMRELRLPSGEVIRELQEHGSGRRVPIGVPRRSGDVSRVRDAGERARLNDQASRVVPRDALPSAAPKQTKNISAGRKREAIIDLMREKPAASWSPREIRSVLEARGLITGEDEGTPTRLLLRRMVEKGELLRPAEGKYTLPPADRSDVSSATAATTEAST